MSIVCNEIMRKKLISFDFAIKYLLKDKGNYDIIEGFISALLKEQGYQPVKILALLDTESNKEQYSQKKSLADLIVEDEQHHKYIIEIERQEVRNFVHKSCFNTSRSIVDQISSGNDYLGIKKIFHISLLYFKVGEAAIYHGKTIVRELETQEKLSIHIKDDHENIFDATEIFPEYIFISIPQFNDKIEREIDEWLYVMKNEDVSPEFKSPYMKKVAEKLSVLKMSAEVQNDYYNYMKELATYKDAIDTAEEKGIQLGKQEGIQLEKKHIAINMLVENQSTSLIARVTGLSEAVIIKLRDERNDSKDSE
jgi:predicted transposase/invertase (TIGR01784 family)